MSDLTDLSSWKLSTGDLIQQLAAFMWLNKGDEHKQLYTTITGARVAYELYNRLTTRNDMDLFQAQCIMAIVDYIKANPKASESQLTAEIERQIALFKEKVQ